MSKFESVESFIMNDKLYGISCIGFFILAAHWHFQGSLLDDLYKIVISVLGFIVIYNFSRKYRMYTCLSNMFQRFGRESLSIYVMQFYLCNIYDCSSLAISNPFVLFTMTFILAVAICYICCWVSSMLKSNRILAFLLLGKPYNK